MTDEAFILKYDGGDADQHAVDLRLLGESLQGIDRIVSDLIIAVSARRLSKRGERAHLVVKAQEPRAGTVTIPILVQESASLLQLGWQLFGSDAADTIGTWFKAVLLFHSGKKNEAEQAMERVAELAKNHTAALDRVDERRHEEVMALFQLLKPAMERLGPAAVQTVAPIGPSVRRLLFFGGKQQQPRAEITLEQADAIRDQGKVEFGPLQSFVLRTDGFTFHTKRLSVHHPERTGFLLAELDDPVAEEENNPYAAAVQRKATIRVQGKAGYRAGQIERLVIMDFSEELGDAA